MPERHHQSSKVWMTHEQPLQSCMTTLDWRHIAMRTQLSIKIWCITVQMNKKVHSIPVCICWEICQTEHLSSERSSGSGCPEKALNQWDAAHWQVAPASMKHARTVYIYNVLWSIMNIGMQKWITHTLKRWHWPLGSDTVTWPMCACMQLHRYSLGRLWLITITVQCTKNCCHSTLLIRWICSIAEEKGAWESYGNQQSTAKRVVQFN